jgi:hypothetical protein
MAVGSAIKLPITQRRNYMSKPLVTFTCKWNIKGFRCNRRVSQAGGLFDEEVFPRLFHAQICETHINEYDKRMLELKRVKNLMKVPSYNQKARHIA